MFYNKISEKTMAYGRDILLSDGMKNEKNFVQHGNFSCYDHSVNVAEKSIEIAKMIPLRIDEKSLVRGALLHDYFLYDWHTGGDKLHGLHHAARALENAEKDFDLGDIERDIIKRHMFPLNIRPPKYRESWIVCLADKICAANEFFAARRLLYDKILGGLKREYYND